MSSFADVERFAKQHTSCGTLTPSASSPARSGYMLTLTCSCGAKYDRWVTAEETEQGLGPPAPKPASPSQAPPRPAPPLTAPLQPTPGRPAPVAATPVAPGPVPVVPEPEEPAKAIPTLPSAPADKQSLEEVMKAALEALDASARKPAAPPRPQRAPAEETAKTPTQPAPPPPAGAPPAPPAAAPPAVTPTVATPAAPPTTEARRPGARPTPDKQALEEALRATLEAFDTSPQTATAPARPRRQPQRGAVIREASPMPEPAPRRRLGIAVIVAVGVGLVAAVGGGWVVMRGRQPVAHVETPARRPAPRLRAPEGDKSAVAQAFGALRDLQALSKPELQFRMYFNRVSFARADVDRYVQSAKDSDVKTALRQVMALHTLAAAAWRAKTLNEPSKWEAVADDPAIELCPPIKRILAIGDDPPNMTRNQWRGVALAASIPLLWDCAGDRLAEVERVLK